MEIITDVRPVSVSYQCDQCRKGEMQQTGLVKPPSHQGELPLFQHKCTNSECGQEAMFGMQYPSLRFLPVQPEQSKKQPKQSAKPAKPPRKAR